MTQSVAYKRPNTLSTEPLPPIECVSWCEDGDGHTDRSHPEDQYCSALDFAIDLARDPDQIDEGGKYYRREATVYLNRDPFSEPYISADITGKLTLDEAEQVATRMLEQVKLGRGEEPTEALAP